jgi:hypothetical protein
MRRHPYLVGRERLHSSTKSRTGSILLRSRRTAKIRSPWEGPSTASRSQHRQQRERQQHKREFPIDLRCCQPQPFRWLHQVLHRAGGAVAGAFPAAVTKSPPWFFWTSHTPTQRLAHGGQAARVAVATSATTASLAPPPGSPSDVAAPAMAAFQLPTLAVRHDFPLRQFPFASNWL